MLTEAEAATKRCPMSFAASQGVSVGGYSHAVAAPAMHDGIGSAIACQTAPLNCIGSGCMAWRWHWQVMADGTHHHVLSAEDKRLGYCGNAGKP